MYGWFDEIMTGLLARGVAILDASPWLQWSATALVVLLRELAWHNNDMMAQLHTAQGRGIRRLATLAHVWRDA